MEKGNKYYELYLVDKNTGEKEPIYVLVNEDRTLRFMKQKTNETKINMDAVSTEITGMEYHEIVSSFSVANSPSNVDLESRIPKMIDQEFLKKRKE